MDNLNDNTTNVDNTQTHTVTATTGIDNDANVSTTLVPAIRTLDKLLVSSNATTYMQELKDFFAKPFPLVVGQLTTTDSVTIAGPLGLPSTHLYGSSVASSKSQGFYGFRSTMVIRLQVNANRFQQGRYFLAFTHSGGSLTSSNSTVPTGRALNYYNMHSATLTQRTQLLKAELDVSCDTETILKVPFVSARNFFPLASANLPTNNNLGDVGFLALNVYAPLVSPTGSTVANYTIWIHHEDVELIGPAAPQADMGKSQSSKEASSAGLGPISAGSAVVARLARKFRDVPMISDYASGVEWVAERMSKAAGAVGWSKPTNLQPSSKMTKQVLPYFGVTDGADDSQPLSYSAKNEVEVLPGFSGTDIDEMSFRHIASIPAWTSTISWAATTTSGSSLYSVQTAPTYFISTFTGAGGAVYIQYPPISFVASHFILWRGSINITLKFVKTEFHSGRLIAAFFPTSPSANVSNINLAYTDYVYREIIDIRQSNSVTLKIPFISDTPFKSNDGNGATGTFVLYVQDPLVAPSSVSSSVTILVEVSAGEDFEVAVPNASNHYATTVPVCGNVTPQADMDDCALYAGPIGGATIVDDQLMSSSTSIGESITSFRSLLKVFTKMQPSPSAGYSYTVGSGTYTVVLPFAMSLGPIISASPPSPASSSVVLIDFVTRISSLFALQRGGMRLKFTYANTLAIPPSATIVNLAGTYTQPYSASNTVAGVTNFEVAAANMPRAFGTPTENNLEVNIPSYTQSFARPVADLIINDNYSNSSSLGYATTTTTIVPLPVVALDATNLTNVTPYKAASDDFSLGRFVSIPLFH